MSTYPIDMPCFPPVTPSSGMSRQKAEAERSPVKKRPVEKTFNVFIILRTAAAIKLENISNRKVRLKPVRIALPVNIRLPRIQRHREIQPNRENRRLETETKAGPGLH